MDKKKRVNKKELITLISAIAALITAIINLIIAIITLIE